MKPKPLSNNLWHVGLVWGESQDTRHHPHGGGGGGHWPGNTLFSLVRTLNTPFLLVRTLTSSLTRQSGVSSSTFRSRSRWTERRRETLLSLSERGSRSQLGCRLAPNTPGIILSEIVHCVSHATNIWIWRSILYIWIYLFPAGKSFVNILQIIILLTQLRIGRHPRVHKLFLVMWGERNHSRQCWKLLYAEFLPNQTSCYSALYKSAHTTLVSECNHESLSNLSCGGWLGTEGAG